jgi:nitrite reductase (NADH) small subunit
MDIFVKVAEVDEIPQGHGKVVEIEGRAIAVFNSGGAFYAIDNTCPHKGGPLGEGVVVGNTVICPWHRWTFDVTSGRCTINPMARVACFEIKVEGNDVLIRAEN